MFRKLIWLIAVGVLISLARVATAEADSDICDPTASLAFAGGPAPANLDL